MSTTTATPPVTAGAIEHVDPRTLLLERNIRESTPGEDLIASVKALGVLQPITAVTSPAGLVVRLGHRRTLAAIEAGRDTVPVYVVGADELDNDAEVQRVISQFDENTARAGLTTADEVGVVEQLVAFGLTAEQITQQARLSREGVDRAIQVSQATNVRKATAEWDEVTLDQAAAIAEFDDDPAAVEALVQEAAKSPGMFPHVLQRKRDDRTRAEKIRKATEELTAAGVTVVDEPNGNSKTTRLEHLLTSAGKSLTPKAHKTCGGRVAWLSYHGDPVYGCTNWKAHGHKERYPNGGFGTGKTAAADMTADEREKASKARKLVIENNKAWDSAQVVRREWLANLAKQKTAPKGAAAHVAAVLAHDTAWLTHYNAGDLAGKWLGTTAYADAAAKATESRALLIALMQVLGKIEGTRTREDWRQNGKNSTAGRHLRFLESAGYPLSDVEKYAISSKTGA